MLAPKVRTGGRRALPAAPPARRLTRRYSIAPPQRGIRARRRIPVVRQAPPSSFQVGLPASTHTPSRSRYARGQVYFDFGGQLYCLTSQDHLYRIAEDGSLHP